MSAHSGEPPGTALPASSLLLHLAPMSEFTLAWNLALILTPMFVPSPAPKLVVGTCMNACTNVSSNACMWSCSSPPTHASCKACTSACSQPAPRHAPAACGNACNCFHQLLCGGTLLLISPSSKRGLQQGTSPQREPPIGHRGADAAPADIGVPQALTGVGRQQRQCNQCWD